MKQRMKRKVVTLVTILALTVGMVVPINETVKIKADVTDPYFLFTNGTTINVPFQRDQGSEVTSYVDLAINLKTEENLYTLYEGLSVRQNTAATQNVVGITKPDIREQDGNYSLRFEVANSWKPENGDSADYVLFYQDTPIENLTFKKNISDGLMFYANGGTQTMEPQSLQVGGTVTLPECSFVVPQGKKFKTWAIGSANSQTTVNPGQEYQLGNGVDKVDAYAVWEDVPAPTADIQLDSTHWNTFSTGVSFGDAYTEAKEVKITGASTESTVSKIEYYLSDQELTLEQAKAIGTWTNYTAPFTLDNNTRKIIYARVTDAVGNQTIVNSSGIAVYWDTTPEPAPEPSTPTPTPTPSPMVVPQKGATIKDNNKNEYRIDNASKTKGTVEFKGTKSKSTTVKIPATVKVNGITYKVTKVANNAFKNNKKIKQISLGKNVTTVGTKAFFGCTAVKKVVIPNNVKTIGDYAFHKMKKLKTITVGTGVVTIGKHAFCHSAKGCVVTIKSKKLKTVKGTQNHGTSKMVIKVPKSKKNAYKKLFKQSKGVKIK